MKKLIRIVSLIAALAPLTASAYIKANSVEEAKTRVTDDGYVVVTYAEGWDKYSKKTARQLMEHTAIKKALGKNTMLLTLGVPDVSTKKDHEENKARFGHLDLSFPNSYPAFIFYNKDGHRLADVCVSFEERKHPKKLARRISEVLDAAARQRQLLAQAETAGGVEKARLLGQAAAVPGLRHPANVARRIREADPDDRSRMHEFVTLNLPHRAIDTASTENWQATLSEIKEMMSIPLLTTEHKQQLCCIMIGLLRRHGGPQHLPALKETISQLRELDPDSIWGKSADDAARLWVKE
jgi:hypothetical protein